MPLIIYIVVGRIVRRGVLHAESDETEQGPCPEEQLETSKDVFGEFGPLGNALSWTQLVRSVQGKDFSSHLLAKTLRVKYEMPSLYKSIEISSWKRHLQHAEPHAGEWG